MAITLNFPSASGAGLAANTFTGAQTINSGTLTASAPALAISQTWNNSGVTFNAATINVTNTASGSASLLFDFQVGGTSRASVHRDGYFMAKLQVSPYYLLTDGGASPTRVIQSGGAAYLNIGTAGTTFNVEQGHIYLPGVLHFQSAFANTGANVTATIRSGTATPEASVTANPGALYLRNNSGTGELWLKTSGTGNTGWTKVL